MAELRERVADERRRLRSVRQRLSAAVEQGAGGNEAWAPFYIAVADYMDASMGRLHAQDVKMGNMIRDKVERVDEHVQRALSELDERLAGNQQRLDRLLAARDELRKDGARALEEFEAAARDFTDFIVQNMGHHGGTTDLAAKLFSTDDWEYMAGITDEDMAREVELYRRVSESMPADLALPDSQ